MLLKTTDGGEIWSIFGNAPSNALLYDICFTDLNVGYAVSRSYSKVLKTTDGGLNWFIQDNGITGYDSYFSVDFIDSNTGVIVGESNNIYRTTNGGDIWIKITSPITCDYKILSLLMQT